MKTSFFKYLAIGAAALSVFACNVNDEPEVIVPEKTTKTVHFMLPAETVSTKTGILYDAGSYLPYFQKGDELGVLFSLPESTSNLNPAAVFENTEDDGNEACFEGEGTVLAGKNNVSIYSFYPASALKRGYQAGTVGLDVPSNQVPVYDSSNGYSFDPKADILVAAPAIATVAEDPDNDYYLGGIDGSLKFARATAVLRVSFSAASTSAVAGEIVKDMTIETTSGHIAGRIVVDLANADVTSVNEVSGSKKIVVEPETGARPYINDGSTYDGPNNIFVCVAPVTIPEGETLTFTINTVNFATGNPAHKIVKSVVVPTGKSIVFESSKPTVFNLTIKDSEIGDPDEEDTTNYSGEWVIAGTDTNPYVLSKFVSGNYYPAVVAESIENDVVTVAGSKADYKLTITKVADGEYSGMYTIKDAGNKYLTAYSTTSNNLKGVAEEALEAGSYWNISSTSGILTIVASKFAGRNEIRVNHSSGSNPRFSCYQSASPQPKVGIYPYADVVETLAPLTPAATPVISLENNTVTLTCTTEGASIYYTLGTTAENTADPTTESNLYNSENKPVITANAYIKAIAVAEGYENSAVAGQALTYQDPSAVYYVKVTSLDDLTSGADYVIVATSSDKSFALPANPTVDGGKITGSEIVVTSNGISESAAAGFIWTITKSGDYYTISDGSKKIYHSNGGASGTNLAYGTSNAYAWSITAASGGTGVFKLAGVVLSNSTVGSRGMLATSTGTFGGYSLTNFTSSGYAGIDFYKLEDTRPVVDTPTFSVSAGQVAVNTSVTISCATEGATIYYTIDGSKPTTSSVTYSGALSITDDVTIKAIAVKDGYKDSGIASASYTVPVCATPAITIDSDGNVTITCSTDDASIHYTTDSTTPTVSSTTYSSSFSVSDGTTVKAIATKSGSKDSAVAEKTYSAGGGPTPQTVTLKYSGSTTTNMDGDNNAAIVGLDDDKWSVIGAKGNNNNFPGLNKAGDIRLYASNGNGNTITVTVTESGATINSIVIDYKQGEDGAEVLVDGSAVTKADGAYSINNTSFIVKNSYTSSSTQVQINSIAITYTPSN